MAADVRVKISGEQTVSPAADEASKSLGGIADAAGKAIDVAKGFVAFEILKQVAEYAAECAKEFAEDEKALISLNAAIDVSTKLSDGAKDSLIKYSEEIAKLTGNTVSSVQGIEAFLITSGRTETQLKAVIQTAADLAVVTGQDLRSSVEQLNATFDGQAGRLAKMFPDLKNYTEAQLEAGAAIDFVETRVRGQAQAMETSASVSMANYNNALGEVKSELGSIFENDWLGPMREILTGVFEWMINHKGEVIGALNGIGLAIGLIITTFNPIIGVIDLVLVGLNMLQQATGGWKLLWLDVQLVALTVFKAITDYLSTMANSIDSVINLLITGFNKVASLVGGKGIALLDNVDISKMIGVTQALEGISKQIEIAKKENEELGKKKPSLGRSGDLASSVSSNEQAGYSEASWRNVTSANPDYRTAYDFNVGNYGNGDSIKNIDWSQAATALSKGFPAISVFQDLITAIKEQTASTRDAFGKTQIGQIAQGASISQAQGNSPMLGGLDSFVKMLGSAVGGLGPLIASFSSVNALLNPLQTIFSAMMSVLGPAINTVLNPLVGILDIVGSTLGKILVPVLNLVTPVIKFIADAFIWLYNTVIMPFGNAIIGVTNLIYNGIVNVMNAIASGINAALGWAGVNISKMATVAVNAGMLTKIDANSLSTAGAATTGTGSTGGSASYAQVRPVNISVTVNTDVIADSGGGFDALVRMINLRAGQLNLAGQL
jgi:hypothetical protein